MTKKTAILLLFTAFTVRYAYAQMGFPNIALAGGPTAGIYFNNTDELNTQLKLAGFSEFPKQFLTLGGGGFIDFEVSSRKSSDFFRIGAFGNGFSSHKENNIGDTLTKAATFDMGMGGFSVEYVKCITSVFDITAGLQIATGSLKLDMYQYRKDFGNYPLIWGEFGGSNGSQNITRNFKVHFYSFEPQLGLGLLVKKAFYLRLQAGYNIAALGKWKADNDVEVSNFPTGIKGNGFSVKLGLNFGIFFREN